jgi:nitroreductase / dihydropteridine reductase
VDITRIAAERYTTKAFDPQKRIEPMLMEKLQTLLHLTPSSINSQPWHFIIAASNEGKAQIARAAHGPYGANEAKILDASHVVVLCANDGWSDAHMQEVVECEDEDGRFASAEAKEKTFAGRNFYVNLHKELGDTQSWMEKQVYIALGSLLFGAAALGIDATPIEGFDRTVLDKELGLKKRGLTSVVIAALGYRSADDFNANLPKSRLPVDQIITHL